MTRLAASLASLSLAAAAAPALAQTVPPRDGLWRGSLGAGITNVTGNSKSFNAGLSADAVRRTEFSTMSGRFLSLYGTAEQNGTEELIVDIIRANASYDHDFSELTYGFLGYDLEKDKVAGLKWRNSPAVGAGLHLRKTDVLVFNVFGGYSYDHESLYDGTKRSFNELLLGEESEHKWTSGVSFKQRLAAYPNLTDTGEYRLQFDAGLLAPLFDRWNITVKYSLRYQSNPPPGAETMDTVLYTGLQYRWGAPE
jgi:putative salt-induced outer membrane protein